ncbi:MAG: D-alanyl-D-alanine carboxypeptidase/D-alanyl-D-alanine-endopeptidase [Melioribacteraceae bacterium]|nr:D-alanyl-D-alanine carboxypeptidase/D-alanyl-D-alanine-endopeptidase [Melioribacteraceae bacterium]
MVKSEIDDLLKNSYFKNSYVAIQFKDLNSNKLIYSKNSNLLSRPASLLKLLTTTAALEYLGENFRFTTKLFYTGEIKNNELSGDLYIRGGGDPELTTNSLSVFIDSLNAFGIESINGNIYGDVSLFDSLYWGKGWMWDDDEHTDFSYFSPLLINDAGVKVVVTPGSIGENPDVEIYPKSNYYSFENLAVTTSEDTSDLEFKRSWLKNKNDLKLIGDISFQKRVDSLKINIERPDLYFLHLFAEKLVESGIKFEGNYDTLKINSDSNPKQIATIRTPIIKAINKSNKNSDNLSAEMLLRAISIKNSGRPATAEGGLMIVDTLIYKLGQNPKDYNIVDGSGLSHYNLLNAQLLIDLLEYIYKNDLTNKYIIPSLPISGISGTLKNRMYSNDLKGNVRAKTGTLSAVSNLSGYLTTASGKEIAFVIMIQNFAGKQRPYRWFQDKICKIVINGY